MHNLTVNYRQLHFRENQCLNWVVPAVGLMPRFVWIILLTSLLRINYCVTALLLFHLWEEVILSQILEVLLEHLAHELLAHFPSPGITETVYAGVRVGPAENRMRIVFLIIRISSMDVHRAELLFVVTDFELLLGVLGLKATDNFWVASLINLLRGLFFFLLCAIESWGCLQFFLARGFR